MNYSTECPASWAKSYRDLESRVAALTVELTAARSARVRELAEKERLAHRLSSLVSVLPGGVLIIGADQIIRDVNPEAMGLLGEPLVGVRFDEVLSRVTVGCEHLALAGKATQIRKENLTCQQAA